MGSNHKQMLATMFALSPNVIPSSLGWPFEESMIDELHQDDLFASYTPKEFDTSFNSITSSPDDQLPAELEYHDGHRNSSTPATKNHMTSTKKSSHNEYERHRRKKLNSLYSSLRSLLPENYRSKNMSIPCTVGRVLKYIPELQRQVERLIRRKDDILLRALPKEGSALASFRDSNGSVPYPTFSAARIDRREVMVQVCMFNDKSAAVSVSKFVGLLEREGLQLMSVSTQTSLPDRTFCSLHLQAKEDIRMESQSFCERLMSLLRG